jgi:hypothetical protein
MKTRMAILALAVVFAAGAFVPAVSAKPSEFDLISRHIKTRYNAKKVSIPFLFLAKAVVHLAKPAGVKSFGVTLYQDLHFSYDTIDDEMQLAMRSTFSGGWTSVVHARSRDGQQAYMYMKEDGADIKIAVVTIERDQAAVIRATISPDRLASFINDPSVFGISLN